jgi:glycosyltransferase involved in cell wall biosynthesis
VRTVKDLDPMHIAFINENSLGHTSHVPRFVRSLEEHPEWGCIPHQIDAMPLPPELRGAERGIRGLHRFGLDGLITRWRRAISLHAARQLTDLAGRVDIQAVVVNTQSAGLSIPDALPDFPCFVALDATFEQLALSPWFGPSRLSRWLHPITLRWLRRQERRLFRHAHKLLPWSERVRESLIRGYAVSADRIQILPPSMRDPGPPVNQSRPRPNLLFIGGDFRRKGGPELLEAWRSQLREHADLHVVTRDAIPSEPGLHIHQGVEAGTAKWLELWTSADLFVFPSHLETFGIVLLEALAFGVPIVSARTGAAEELVQQDRNGALLKDTAPATIARTVIQLLRDPARRATMAISGRRTFKEHFDLNRNAHQLAGWLRESRTR